MNKIPGLEKAIRANLVGMDGMVLIDSHGKQVGKMTATGNADQQGLVSEFEILRGKLAEVLCDLTKEHPKVRYVFGEQISAMAYHEGPHGPITVSFLNGRPAETFDLVVAADGATSRTRAIGLNCGVRDHLRTLNAWAAYFSFKPDLLNHSPFGHGYSTTPGRMVALASASEQGPGWSRGTLVKVYPKGMQNATMPFLQAHRQGTETLKAFVHAEYEGAGWYTKEVLSGMMESEDFYASEMVQVHVPELHKGRFVLVGDAGYAAGPTGGGTSLAMAGAYILAGEIASACNRSERDTASEAILDGLQGYEERMKPIIAEMQAIPPGIPGIMAPQTEWGVWLRNLIFGLVCAALKLGPYFNWVQGLWSSAFRSSDEFGLPEYEWEE